LWSEIGEVLSGRGKTPLARSFQPVSAGSDPFQFESFSVDGDVMAVPAHGGQLLRIMIPTSGTRVDVMDLEPIAGMVPFDGATTVSGEDESSDLVGNGL
jgi:hypothetical protein